jgi:hypothetical protein
MPSARVYFLPLTAYQFISNISFQYFHIPRELELVTFRAKLFISYFVLPFLIPRNDIVSLYQWLSFVVIAKCLYFFSLCVVASFPILGNEILSSCNDCLSRNCQTSLIFVLFLSFHPRNWTLKRLPCWSTVIAKCLYFFPLCVVPPFPIPGNEILSLGSDCLL